MLIRQMWDHGQKSFWVGLTWFVPNVVLLPGILKYVCLVNLFWNLQKMSWADAASRINTLGKCLQCTVSG